MKIHQAELVISTPGRGAVDITSRIADVVAESGITTGLVTVFIRHTSASLVIQENADPAVLRDLGRFFEELASESYPWEHDAEGPDDMPAHARCAVTRTSEQIPIVRGRLGLGTWQGVYVWEHRRRPHERRVIVHVTGI